MRNIHAGELTSILLSKRGGMAFVTNDGKAKRFCEENGVEWLDILTYSGYATGSVYLTREKLKT